MVATFRYVLITAVRDRMIIALILALIVAVSGCMIVAGSALAEQNAFGVSFSSEACRLIVSLGVITFVCFHIRRMYETREIEAILARPISRASFVLAYFVAYAAIAALLALVASGIIGMAFAVTLRGLVDWGISLALESMIVVALSLFAAMALESATAAVIAALGFYVLARMASSLRFIVETHSATFESTAVNQVLRWIVEVIVLVLPRIDLFGQSRWLVYGPGGDWGVATLSLQVVIFVPLILAATTRDLYVRRF